MLQLATWFAAAYKVKVVHDTHDGTATAFGYL